MGSVPGSTAAPGAVDHEALARVVEPLLAQVQPGEQIEVVVAAAASTSIVTYDGSVEKLTVADTSGLGIRVVRDHQMGFASAGSLDIEVAAETLAAARDNAQFAAPDPTVFVAEEDGVTPIQQAGLWHDGVFTMTLDDKIAMALDLEASTRALDDRVFGVRAASYGDSHGVSLLATTTGIRARNRSTMSSISVQALARQGDETQSGGAFDAQRDPHDLVVADVAAEAVERTTRLLGARQPESQRVTLVLEPDIAASIIGIIGGMLSGERALKGRTPFADRLADTIADTRFSLTDEPNDERSFGARIYDGEGLAARRNVLIDAGQLEAFLYNTSAAAKAGTRSTASASRGVRSTPAVGWHALAVAPGEGDLDSIVAATDLGVLVQSMSGLHSGVNAVSGDFSVGVQGMMIRNGEIAEPFREATVASTLPRLLTDIDRIGADVEFLPSQVATPSISIAGVSLSGA